MNIRENSSYRTPIFIVSGLLALVFLLFFSGCAASDSNTGTTINLMDYVTVTISGDDGYGKASYSFDYGTFEDVLAEKLDVDADSVQFLADVMVIEEGIQISLDKTSELSNGDSVVLTVSYNDEAAKNYKLSFQGGTATYNVTELTEVAEFTASENDVIALLSETTVLHYMQDIPVVPERIQGFAITDTQVDYQRNAAQVDYNYDLDCTIAVLSITGSVQYKYENDAWVNTHISHSAQIKEYTLSGAYKGTEWDIANAGVSCNARYEITELDDGSYQAAVTWSGNEESPNMSEIMATFALANSFDTSRFVITDNKAQTAAIGNAPYLYRALKFDFINGGFTNDGEISLLKSSD